MGQGVNAASDDGINLVFLGMAIVEPAEEELFFIIDSCDKRMAFKQIDPNCIG